VGGILLASPFLSQVGATVYTLPPGGVNAALASPYPVGGTLLATVTAPFSSSVISGTLVSSVFNADAANPYGPAMLTFTYSLSISPSSPDGSSEMTVSSFAGFLTDVSFNPAGGGVAPSNFTRSSGTGDVVRSVWIVTPIMPGQTGALVVVQTDAVSFHDTTAGIIDGQTVNVDSLAPLTVPEPGTGMVLVAGFCMLGWTIRRRQ